MSNPHHVLFLEARSLTKLSKVTLIAQISKIPHVLNFLNQIRIRGDKPFLNLSNMVPTFVSSLPKVVLTSFTWNLKNKIHLMWGICLLDYISQMCQGFMSDCNYSTTQTTFVFAQVLLVREFSMMFRVYQFHQSSKGRGKQEPKIRCSDNTCSSVNKVHLHALCMFHF